MPIRTGTPPASFSYSLAESFTTLIGRRSASLRVLNSSKFLLCYGKSFFRSNQTTMWYEHTLRSGFKKYTANQQIQDGLSQSKNDKQVKESRNNNKNHHHHVGQIQHFSLHCGRGNASDLRCYVNHYGSISSSHGARNIVRSGGTLLLTLDHLSLIRSYKKSSDELTTRSHISCTTLTGPWRIGSIQQFDQIHEPWRSITSIARWTPCSGTTAGATTNHSNKPPDACGIGRAVPHSLVHSNLDGCDAGYENE